MATNDRTLRILMQIRADIADLEKLHGGLDKTRAKLKETGAAGQSLFAGFAAGAALGAFQAVTSALAEIPRAFSSAVSEGIRFNATLETSQLGIAAIIKQFDTSGRFSNFDDAMRESGKAIDLLKTKALQSPATFEQLVAAFQGVSGAASAANIPLKQQVDLVVLMSQALAGLGIRSDQILQESRALLTGNITEDALAAKILGISKKDIDNAKAQGQLFEFLTGKLNAFAEAGQRGTGTYTTQVANLGDALTQLKGIATEDLFKGIVETLKTLNEELAKPETREAAATFGSVLRFAFDDVVESGKIAKQMFSDIGTALQFISGNSGKVSFGAWQQFTKEQGANLAAVREQIAGAATLAQQDAARSELTKLILGLLERQKAATGDMKMYIGDAVAEALRLAHEFESVRGTSAAAAANIQTLVAALDAASAKSLAARIAGLTASANDAAAKTAIDNELALAAARATGDEQLSKSEQRRQSVQTFLLQATKAYGATTAEVMAKEYEDSLRAVDAIELQKSALKGANAERREERDLLRDIQAHREAIESNKFLTIDQQHAQLIPILEQERDQLRATGQEWAALKVQMELATMTSSGGVVAGLTSWVNSFGTAAQQVSNTLGGVLNTAISGTANAITGLVTGTKNLGQAWAQVGSSILQQVIQLGLQMVATKVLGSALTRANAAEQSAAGAQIAAAHAPAAAATSISSFGSAAVVGGIAAAATIALIIGLLSGGFERGGYTGDIGSKQVAGVVHGGEYVFSKGSVDALGLPLLERLHRGQITLRGYATGGYVAPSSSVASLPSLGGDGAGAQINMKTIVVNDTAALRREILNSDEAEIMVVNAVNGNAHRIRRS